MEKQRHGLATLWLWLMLLSNLAVAVFMIAEHDMAIWIYATEEKANLLFYGLISGVDLYCNAMIAIGVLSIASVVGSIMLLKWKKAGLWTIVGASAINLIIMLIFAVKGGVSSAVICSILADIAIPFITYGVLQMHVNNISAWSHLE